MRRLYAAGELEPDHVAIASGGGAHYLSRGRARITRTCKGEPDCSIRRRTGASETRGIWRPRSRGGANDYSVSFRGGGMAGTARDQLHLAVCRIVRTQVVT